MHAGGASVHPAQGARAAGSPRSRGGQAEGLLEEQEAQPARGDRHTDGAHRRQVDDVDEHAILAKTSLLLGVTGQIQRTDGVVHLIADTLWDPQVKLQADVRSRDFH